MAAQPLADVFISYARTDQAIAENVANMLKSEGFEVWFDKKLYAGARWESLLTETLASAKSVLVIWSKQSVTRPWVLKEADIARMTGRLVPMAIDDCTVPARFTKQQIAKMQGWSGAGHHPELERLLSGLAHLAPPSRVDNVRPGFAADFLGPEILLPAITGTAEEFRYLHFSVVMNPARRMAWYVAYNMQASVRTRRSDTWLPDPMLPASFQPQDEHFRGTGLDRGHIVSPASVSWGSARQSELAYHQAFFWTNTVPQHPLMNQRWWLAVEQWERALAVKYGKAIGFAGPVLAADDPPHGPVEQVIGRLRVRQNFRLPRRFWKLVMARDRTGVLRVAAFLLDQEALLNKARSARAVPPSRFRVKVETLEAQTGLDVGDTIRGAGSFPK